MFESCYVAPGDPGMSILAEAFSKSVRYLSRKVPFVGGYGVSGLRY